MKYCSSCCSSYCNCLDVMKNPFLIKKEIMKENELAFIRDQVEREMEERGNLIQVEMERQRKLQQEVVDFQRWKHEERLRMRPPPAFLGL